jgi:hypothetical protein
MSERMKLSLRFLLTLAACVALVSTGSNGPSSFIVHGVAGGLVLATGTLVSLYSVVAVPRPKKGA